MARYQQARADYELVNTIKPDSLEGIYGANYRELLLLDQAYAQYYSAEEDKAEAKLDEALKINPNLYQAYILKAQIQVQEKEIDKAITTYSQVVTMQPKQPYAYEQRGLLYKEKKQEQLALEDLNQAAQLYAEEGRTYEQSRVQAVIDYGRGTN
jgi:tetratricopeptide (TPR) repeat protein